MEMKLETEKLRRFIRAALLPKGDKPLLEKTNVYSTKEGLMVNDLQLGAIGVVLFYRNDAFISYTQEANEIFVLDQNYLKILRDAFKSSTVEVKTDKTKLYLRGEKDKWEHDLLGELTLEQAPRIEVVDVESIGILPKKLDQQFLRTKFKVQAPELQDLRESGQYLFEADDTKLTVTTTDNGIYTKDLKCTGNSERIKVNIDGDFLSSITPNLSGEVSFAIQSQNGKEGDVLFLSCTERTTKTTYLITAKE